MKKIGYFRTHEAVYDVNQFSRACQCPCSIYFLNSWQIFECLLVFSLCSARQILSSASVPANADYRSAAAVRCSHPTPDGPLGALAVFKALGRLINKSLPALRRGERARGVKNSNTFFHGSKPHIYYLGQIYFLPFSHEFSFLIYRNVFSAIMSGSDIETAHRRKEIVSFRSCA